MPRLERSGAVPCHSGVGEQDPSPEPCRVGLHDAARPGGLPLAGQPAELRSPAPWRRHRRRPRDPGLGDHPLPPRPWLARPPGRPVCADRRRDRRRAALAVLLAQRPVGRRPRDHRHRQRQGLRGPGPTHPAGRRPLPRPSAGRLRPSRTPPAAAHAHRRQRPHPRDVDGAHARRAPSRRRPRARALLADARRRPVPGGARRSRRRAPWSPRRPLGHHRPRPHRPDAYRRPRHRRPRLERPRRLRLRSARDARRRHRAVAHRRTCPTS